MSTSPSWFDKDKFSRLVKKVGPKTPAAPVATGQVVLAKTPAKPLLKEALLVPGMEEPVPATKVSILPPQAQLPPEDKEEKKEAPIPKPAAISRAPAQPPGEAKRLSTQLSSRLPKIDFSKPPEEIIPVPDNQIAEEAPPIPRPLHSDAGAPPEDELEAAPEAVPEVAEEEDEPLPVPESRPPMSPKRMMTSQSLSLGKKPAAQSELPIKIEPKTEPKVEPIRAPESAIKAPALPGGVTSGKLPQRTAPLPALKSLFQYEIPGGQGTMAAKPPAEEPAPKAPLPTFSFSKSAAKPPTETLPPSADEEEDVPSFGGISDAGHLAEAAESEEPELTAEDLAAEWGKADEMKGELERVIKERDDALTEGDELLKQLRELREKPTAENEKSADTAELDFVTKERDEVRSEYIKLREDFEKLKQEQLQAPATSEPAGPDPEQEKKIEKLLADVSAKDRELRATKIQLKDLRDAPKPKEADPELQKELEKLRGEVDAKDRELGLVKAQLNDIPEDDIPEDKSPELQKEIDKLRQDVDAKTRDIEAKNRELGLVKAQLNDIPEDESLELKKEIDKLNQDVDAKTLEVQAKDRELTLVKSQLNDMPEPGNPEAEKEVEKLRADLAEKDREMVALKVAAGQTDVAIDKLKEEIVGVRNEVKKAQNEASVAQRGLALSQKALQETRDALREASEAAKPGFKK